MNAARTGRRVLLGLGIVAAGAGFAAVLGVVLAPSSGPDPNAPNGYGAELACEKYVTDRLPGATQFSGEAFTGTSPTWSVTGTAKSPTIASLVLNYQCTVTIPDGKTWQLTSLQDLG